MRITNLNQTTELTPINAIQPHPKNPRKGNTAAIQASIETNGFYGTIIAQRGTNLILAGNHRWLAAKAAGLTEIPVTWVDVTDDQALRILLVDNRTNDLASYHDDALAELLRDLQNDTGTLLGTGYDPGDLEGLLRDAAQQELAPDQTEDLTERYQVLITCENEATQVELLRRFQEEGLACRALLS